MNQYEKVSHMGVDNHRTFSRLTARDAGNRVLLRQRLEHGDRVELRAALRRFPAGTPVIFEGTFGWGWLADELKECLLEPHLSSSRKVAGWREARGLAKSNVLDADLLSELWPQQPRWWEVWLAPAEVRDRRELLRYRMALVAVQTMTKNRIHATLHRHGILCGFSDVFGVAGWQWLQRLMQGDSVLREAGRVTLAGYVQLLEQIRRQIAAVTRRVRQEVSADEQARLWHTLPGIGWVLAYTIGAEVGDAARFRRGGELASYSLLAPRAQDSGEELQDTPIGRHVGHAGRMTLKWAFIEAARGAVRKDARFRAVFQRRTENGRKDRNRGYIAVARRLAETGLACVKKKTPYRPTPPPRPGSREDGACGPDGQERCGERGGSMQA
jgi:transposase